MGGAEDEVQLLWGGGSIMRGDHLQQWLWEAQKLEEEAEAGATMVDYVRQRRQVQGQRQTCR